MKKGLIKLFLLIVFAVSASLLIFYNAERAKKVEVVEDYLIAQNELEDIISKDTNYNFQNPKIIVNPYGNSPLTALIIFETNDLTAPTVTIHGKDKNTTFTNTFTPSKKHILPIYGLYAGENKISLKVNNNTVNLTIKTDELPEDMIKPTSVKAKKESLSNELYFVTPSSKGYTAAYDVNGDVRWYITNNYIWDIKKLHNGHLLLSSDRLINPPYYTTGLVEIDLMGKVYYEYTLPGGYHHDVFEMDNGDLLIASNDFSSGTTEDYVVLMDRDNGKIIKEWDLKKILPTTYGLNEMATDYDWFHNNSVWYDKKTNSITLSGRHQDAVINIDFETGDLNWIIGDPNGWNAEYLKYFFTGGDGFEWQYAQHAAEILPNGNVFIFDNGNNRSKIKEEYVDADHNYSRAVIYKINTDNMTIEQVWEYGKELGAKFYSPYISDVDYLSDNHYLILSGGNASKDGKYLNVPAGLDSADNLRSTLVEIQNNKVIFELILPTNDYRAEKINIYDVDSYYLNNASRLGNMGETKTDKSINPLFNKGIDETYKSKNIKITKEADRLVFTGTFQKDDKVSLILNGVFSNKTYNVRISNRPYTAMCVDIFNESNKEGITVNKYINDVGMKGKYYIYVKINDTIYDPDLFVLY